MISKSQPAASHCSVYEICKNEITAIGQSNLGKLFEASYIEPKIGKSVNHSLWIIS
jgi:hypothetical protein